MKKCKSGSRKKKINDVKFFRFPKDFSLRNKWIEACGYNASDFSFQDRK